MKSMMLTIGIVCLGCLNYAVAKPTDVPEAMPLVTIDFPESWKLQHIDLALITGTPEGDIAVVCQTVVTGTNAKPEKIFDTLDQDLTEDAPGGFKISGKPKPLEETVIDGSKAFKISATGIRKGVETVGFAFLIPIKEDSGLVFGCWGTPEAIKTHKTVLKKVLDSIHRKSK